MTERTFTYRDITVVIHRAKVRDRLVRDTVLGKLQRDGIGDAPSRFAFATAVAQSTVTGMQWVDASADAEELKAAFNRWLDMDGALYDEWDHALYVVNLPMNNPDLLPPEQLTAEKKDE